MLFKLQGHHHLNLCPSPIIFISYFYSIVVRDWVKNRTLKVGTSLCISLHGFQFLLYIIRSRICFFFFFFWEKGQVCVLIIDHTPLQKKKKYIYIYIYILITLGCHFFPSKHYREGSGTTLGKITSLKKSVETFFLRRRTLRAVPLPAPLVKMLGKKKKRTKYLKLKTRNSSR